MKKNQILGDLIANVKVDNPIHQVKGDEGDGKEDPGILVNVRWSDAQHLMQVLLALQVPDLFGCEGLKNFRIVHHRALVVTSLIGGMSRMVGREKVFIVVLLHLRIVEHSHGHVSLIGGHRRNGTQSRGYVLIQRVVMVANLSWRVDKYAFIVRKAYRRRRPHGHGSIHVVHI